MTGIWHLEQGDCREVVRRWVDEGVVFDAIVTDPPYDLTSIVKRFGKEGAAPAKSNGATGVYARASKGFMGQQWDGTGVAFDPETWRVMYDALKPGAHLAAFGGTRTFHRMAVAIEDAGFEIRDTLFWAYGTGFPKSHDVSKGIDKKFGAEREIVGKSKRHVSGKPEQRTAGLVGSSTFAETVGMGQFVTAPATEQAAAWEGWGTALKPAVEPIILARKPLIGTVADNVLTYGTGAINIDDCRIETQDNLNGGAYSGGDKDPRNATSYVTGTHAGIFVQPEGRWPANLLHDGSEEVVALFPNAPGQLAAARRDGTPKTHAIYGDMNHNSDADPNPRGDKGSAARYFSALGYTDEDTRFHYSAKASKADRAGSGHPTVKPLSLMRWLTRLITPPGGLILEPFAGSGSTLQAAIEQGFDVMGVEMGDEYCADIRRRMENMKRD